MQRPYPHSRKDALMQRPYPYSPTQQNVEKFLRNGITYPILKFSHVLRQPQLLKHLLLLCVSSDENL